MIFRTEPLCQSQDVTAVKANVVGSQVRSVTLTINAFTLMPVPMENACALLMMLLVSPKRTILPSWIEPKKG
jgi:hypothetical protein